MTLGLQVFEGWTLRVLPMDFGAYFREIGSIVRYVSTPQTRGPIGLEAWMREFAWRSSHSWKLGV